jgi:hypothetical protein
LSIQVYPFEPPQVPSGLGVPDGGGGGVELPPSLYQFAAASPRHVPTVTAIAYMSILPSIKKETNSGDAWHTVQTLSLEIVDGFLSQHVYGLSMNIVHQADGASGVKSVLEVCQCYTDGAVVMLIVESIDIGAESLC